MMDFLRLYQHLLPDGRAWRTTVDKRLRQFFQGLSVIPEDVKDASDQIFEDIFPQTTSELETWEDQFGLPMLAVSEQERRDRLEATWRELFGGQDPRYIQDTLQAAGFDVYVHQWWEPVPGRPNGGSVDGNATPSARDPFDYLWDGVSPREFIGCGHVDAYCGGDSTFANSQLDVPGYVLVNKVREKNQTPVCSGHIAAVCGGARAASGAEVLGFKEKVYQIPNDPNAFPYFLYLGGETFPAMATVSAQRREEFEALCLRICPAQQWLGVLVNYT
jgi:hypothetical protein